MNMNFGEDIGVRAAGSFNDLTKYNWLNVISFGDAAPAGDITITLQQASNVIGSGAAALLKAPNVSVFIENTTTGARGFVEPTVSEAGVVVIPGADVPADHAIVFSIRADQFDLNRGLPFAQAVVTGDGIGEVKLDIASERKYQPSADA